MNLNNTQQLILNLINEYDSQGHILDVRLLAKYSNLLTNNSNSAHRESDFGTMLSGGDFNNNDTDFGTRKEGSLYDK